MGVHFSVSPEKAQRRGTHKCGTVGEKETIKIGGLQQPFKIYFGLIFELNNVFSIRMRVLSRDSAKT